jgi:hypothetical protein
MAKCHFNKIMYFLGMKTIKATNLNGLPPFV